MDELFMALALYALGGTTMLWPKRLEMAAHGAAMALAAAGSGLLLCSAGGYLLGAQGSAPGYLAAWGWGSYSLQADAWSAAFLLMAGLAGLAASIYAYDYGKSYRGSRIRQLGGLWNLFLLSMAWVLMAGDAFTFILAWEMMALTSFLLVNHECAKKETVQAAYQYMVMTHLGTAAILAAFYLLGSASADFSFAALARNSLPDGMRTAAFLCAFAGFALKAGLMPLHVWLPNAHPAAPSHVSALMSGVMLKVALYGFGRFVFQFLGAEALWQGALVLLAGLVSAVLGALYATMEKDMKRILAYSSVENMGIIFAAFGCGMMLVAMGEPALSLVAFTAALVHSFSHGLMKGLLFMSAGAVMHATGSKNIELMGALAKRMPYTAAFTLVGAMALSSLPLTSGFVGEWLFLQGMATLAWQADAPELRLLAMAAFALLGLAGALALGCFVRLYGVAFLGRRRSGVVLRAQEAPFFMRVGMGMEAALLLVFGVFPAPLVRAMQTALAGRQFPLPMETPLGVLWNGAGSFSVYSPVILLGLALLAAAVLFALLAGRGNFVRQEATWNCGTLPTRRQQYTATGFSKPLRRAFDWLLRPRRERVFLERRHAYFGRRLQYRLTLPDRFSQWLYEPLQRAMVRLSAALRLVQQGSVQLYIGYTMAAMLLVLAWGVM